MSRLIDADKLSSKSCPMGKRKYCSNCGEKRTIKNPYTNQSISCDDIRFDFLQMIDREKTVKAIPVEWIKKWDADKNKDFYDCCKLFIDDFNENDVKRIKYKDMLLYNTIQALLEDCEKENESNI